MVAIWYMVLKKTFHLRGRFCFHFLKNMAQNNYRLSKAPIFIPHMLNFAKSSPSFAKLLGSIGIKVAFIWTSFKENHNVTSGLLAWSKSVYLNKKRTEISPSSGAMCAEKELQTKVALQIVFPVCNPLFFLIMFLWQIGSSFDNLAKKISIKGSKFLAQWTKMVKNIIFSKWLFSSKKSQGQVKCNFDSPAEIVRKKGQKVFAQYPKTIKIRKVLQKFLFLKLFWWTCRMQSWQLRRNFIEHRPKTLRASSDNVKRKYFSKNICFSWICFYEHVKCSFDGPSESVSRKGQKCFAQCPKMIKKT